jgi:hypothetical protein
MNKMFMLVVAALGTDSIASGINSLQHSDPNFLVTIANAIINAVIAVIAVFHLFKSKKVTPQKDTSF